jgi:tetratricopeptide (TPR) repeat protein
MPWPITIAESPIGANVNYDKAISDFSEAIQLEPNHIAAYYKRGVAYESQRSYGKSINDYNEALRLNPNHAPGC